MTAVENMHHDESDGEWSAIIQMIQHPKSVTPGATKVLKPLSTDESEEISDHILAVEQGGDEVPDFNCESDEDGFRPETAGCVGDVCDAVPGRNQPAQLVVGPPTSVRAKNTQECADKERFISSSSAENEEEEGTDSLSAVAARTTELRERLEELSEARKQKKALLTAEIMQIQMMRDQLSPPSKANDKDGQVRTGGDGGARRRKHQSQRQEVTNNDDNNNDDDKQVNQYNEELVFCLSDTDSASPIVTPSGHAPTTGSSVGSPVDHASVTRLRLQRLADAEGKLQAALLGQKLNSGDRAGEKPVRQHSSPQLGRMLSDPSGVRASQLERRTVHSASHPDISSESDDSTSQHTASASLPAPEEREKARLKALREEIKRRKLINEEKERREKEKKKSVRANLEKIESESRVALMRSRKARQQDGKVRKPIDPMMKGQMVKTGPCSETKELGHSSSPHPANQPSDNKNRPAGIANTSSEMGSMSSVNHVATAKAPRMGSEALKAPTEVNLALQRTKRERKEERVKQKEKEEEIARRMSEREERLRKLYAETRLALQKSKKRGPTKSLRRSQQTSTTNRTQDYQSDSYRCSSADVGEDGTHLDRGNALSNSERAAATASLTRASRTPMTQRSQDEAGTIPERTLCLADLTSPGDIGAWNNATSTYPPVNGIVDSPVGQDVFSLPNSDGLSSPGAVNSDTDDFRLSPSNDIDEEGGGGEDATAPSLDDGEVGGGDVTAPSNEANSLCNTVSKPIADLNSLEEELERVEKELPSPSTATATGLVRNPLLQALAELKEADEAKLHKDGTDLHLSHTADPAVFSPTRVFSVGSADILVTSAVERSLSAPEETSSPEFKTTPSPLKREGNNFTPTETLVVGDDEFGLLDDGVGHHLRSPSPADFLEFNVIPNPDDQQHTNPSSGVATSVTKSEAAAVEKSDDKHQTSSPQIEDATKSLATPIELTEPSKPQSGSGVELTPEVGAIVVPDSNKIDRSQSSPIMRKAAIPDEGLKARSCSDSATPRSSAEAKLLKHLGSGSILLKHTRGGRGKPHSRFFKVESQTGIVSWAVSRNSRKFKRARINRLITGASTVKIYRDVPPDTEARSFTLEVTGHDRNLDLVAPTHEEYQTWMEGVRLILQKRRERSGQQQSAMR